jgi:hypothetical protein
MEDGWSLFCVIDNPALKTAAFVAIMTGGLNAGVGHRNGCNS